VGASLTRLAGRAGQAMPSALVDLCTRGVAAAATLSATLVWKT